MEKGNLFDINSEWPQHDNWCFNWALIDLILHGCVNNVAISTLPLPVCTYLKSGDYRIIWERVVEYLAERTSSLVQGLAQYGNTCWTVSQQQVRIIFSWKD